MLTRSKRALKLDGEWKQVTLAHVSPPESGTLIIVTNGSIPYGQRRGVELSRYAVEYIIPYDSCRKTDEGIYFDDYFLREWERGYLTLFKGRKTFAGSGTPCRRPRQQRFLVAGVEICPVAREDEDL